MMERESIFKTITRAQESAPVDVEGLCRRLGIRVIYRAMPDEVSGSLAKVGDDRFEITVNERHPETRQRFTIAHELGHYVNHRHLLGDGLNDSKAYRVTEAAEHYNPRIGPRQETEANQFAASLLMPAPLVNAMLREDRTVREMARTLKVSDHAMSIRAGRPYVAA